MPSRSYVSISNDRSLSESIHRVKELRSAKKMGGTVSLPTQKMDDVLHGVWVTVLSLYATPPT